MNYPKSTQFLKFLPLLFLIGIAHFCVDTMLGIWPLYKSMAHLDIAKAGLIVALGAFIGEGSQMIFGTYSDKGYRKHLIIFGLVLSMAATFLVYSSHYLVLFALFLMTCIGSGCFHPCAASLVGSLVPGRSALLMSIFAASGSLGLASSQILFTQTYSLFAGRTYLLAIPAFALAALLVFYPFPRVVASRASSHKDIFKDYVSFFKNPHLKALYFVQVANQSILWGTIFILPDALKTLGNTEWICYGGGHFCLILGAASMVIPAGYLADLYSARQVMLYGGLISCAAFYFILFSGGLSIPIVLTILFILGATLSLINPIAIALGNRLEPLRSGTVSAFLMGMVWCVSEALGPGGVGIMSSFFEDYAPVKALAILGSFFLIQIYATISLPKIEELAPKKAIN